MESKGTVTISIEEYDRLRKSDEALRENRTLVFTYTEYHEKFREYLMENNDALERIKKEWKEDEMIQAMFSNNHVQGGKKYITADVARFGSDKAVIGYWNGWRLEEVITLDISKTTDIELAIKTLRFKYRKTLK